MDTKRKRSALDLVLATLLLLALGSLVYRAAVGLQYRWNWGAIPQYLFYCDPQSHRWVPGVLTKGLFTTIRLSFWSGLLATVIGATTALCRTSDTRFGRLMGRAYVELVRGLPPLVVIFIFYFFVGDRVMNLLGVERWVNALSPRLQGLIALTFSSPALISPFLSALLALAVLEGAYISEIIRAGIESIERGQWEAASALGLSKLQTLRHVIFPQAMKIILPPLTGQYISTVKDTAIVSVISIQELTFQGMELISSTYLTFEVWITVTVLYLALTFSLSAASRRWEMRSQP